MVAQAVGLLELHLRDLAREPFRPGVWIKLLVGRAGGAGVADIEAEPQRNVGLVAIGQEILDPRERRRLPRRRQVFQHEELQAYSAGVARDLSEALAKGGDSGLTPLR